MTHDTTRLFDEEYYKSNARANPLSRGSSVTDTCTISETGLNVSCVLEIELGFTLPVQLPSLSAKVLGVASMPSACQPPCYDAVAIIIFISGTS